MAAGAQLFSPLPSVLDGTASTRRPHNGRDDILKLRAWQTWKMIAYVDLSNWLPKTLKNSREIESKQDLEWYKTTKSCWDIWVCLKIEELPQNCHGLSARSSSSHIYNYVGCLPFLHKPIRTLEKFNNLLWNIYIYMENHHYKYYQRAIFHSEVLDYGYSGYRVSWSWSPRSGPHRAVEGRFPASARRNGSDCLFL